MAIDDLPLHRRSYLGVFGLAALAGCTSETDDESDSGDGDTGETETNGNGSGEDDGGGSADDSAGDAGDSEPGDDDGDEEGDGGDDQPANEPEAQSFEGSGAEVIEDVNVAGGLTIVDAAHTGGSSNFQVLLVPSEGDVDELFVNAIGEWEGTVAELIPSDTYTIDVEADGDWTLEVRQPRANSGDALPLDLSDNVPDVVGPYEFSGSHTASGEHSGEQNFIVRVFPPEGDFETLVFNEIGEFEGETTFRHDGVGWVAAFADGEYSVELE